MVQSMLDLDVYRDGKTITIPVTMQAYHHYLYGAEDNTISIDLDRGNVGALCTLADDGFYQPLETEFINIECNGGIVSFEVLDIEYNMFTKSEPFESFDVEDSNDDLIHPHALVRFKLRRIATPIVKYNYGDFNPAVKAILDALYQNEPRIHHNAWASKDGTEEFVSSIPGDVLWQPGIPCSFRFSVTDNGKNISVELVSCSYQFKKEDLQKILVTLERANNHEKSAQFYLNDEMFLCAKDSNIYPSAIEVSAGSTYALLSDLHHSLGKVFEFIYYGLEIGAL